MVYTRVPSPTGRAAESTFPKGTCCSCRGRPRPDATYADVAVDGQPDPGVPKGSMVSVNLADLQEMQNHMRANIDQGLGDPAGPPGPGRTAAGAAAEPGHHATPPYASGLQPDANAAAELSQVAQDANSRARPCSARPPRPPRPPAASRSSQNSPWA